MNETGNFGPGYNLAHLIEAAAVLVARHQYRQAVEYVEKAKYFISGTGDVLSLFFGPEAGEQNTLCLLEPEVIPPCQPIPLQTGNKGHQYCIFTPDIAFKGFFESLLLGDCPGMAAYASYDPETARWGLQVRLERMIEVITDIIEPQESPYEAERIRQVLSLVPAEVMTLVGDIRFFMVPGQFKSMDSLYLNTKKIISPSEIMEFMMAGSHRPNQTMGLHLLGKPFTRNSHPDQVLLSAIGRSYLDAISADGNMPLPLKSFLKAFITVEGYQSISDEQHRSDFGNFFAYVISLRDPELMASNVLHGADGFMLGDFLAWIFDEFFKADPAEINQDLAGFMTGERKARGQKALEKMNRRQTGWMH